jgi:glutamate-1-semialdehyde 2,1-aminomutase
MDLVAPVGPAAHYGTYNANPLVMAVGLACLREVLTDDVYEHLNRLGDQMAEGQKDLISSHGLPASVTHVGPIGGLLFAPEVPTNYREARICDKEMWAKYWYGMLNRGVIPMGCAWFEEWSISVAHTEEDLELTLKAIDEAFADIF